MNHAGIRSALSRIAWAYLLIHLHFRLNNLDLLPDWAGYLLIFSSIALLSGELRDLPLLRPFCILLGAVSGVDWLSFLLTGADYFLKIHLDRIIHGKIMRIGTCCRSGILTLRQFGIDVYKRQASPELVTRNVGGIEPLLKTASKFSNPRSVLSENSLPLTRL